MLKSYAKDALPVIRTYTANQQMKLWIDDSLTEGEKGKRGPVYMLLADIVGKPMPTGVGQEMWNSRTSCETPSI